MVVWVRPQAMAACAAAGQGGAAVELLDELEAVSGLTPTTYTYNVALEACTKQNVRRR